MKLKRNSLGTAGEARTINPHRLKTRRVRRRKFRPDGTTHFTHVEYRTDDGMRVGIADYVTPELGELLCTLHNELDRITRSLASGRPPALKYLLISKAI